MSKRGEAPSNITSGRYSSDASNESGEPASKKQHNSSRSTQKKFRAVLNEIYTRFVTNKIEPEYFDDLLEISNMLITHFEDTENTLSAQLKKLKHVKQGNRTDFERPSSPDVNNVELVATKDLVDNFRVQGIKCSDDLNDLAHKGVVSPSKLHALVVQGGVKCVGISYKLRKLIKMIKKANAPHSNINQPTDPDECAVTSSGGSDESDKSGNIDDESQHNSRFDQEKAETA